MTSVPGRSLSKSSLKWQLANVPKGFKKFNCNKWWQLCQIWRIKSLQQSLANVPDWLSKFSCNLIWQLCQNQRQQFNHNNHWQMCLSNWATTGKCAKMIEQKTPRWATVKQNRDNVPPWETASSYKEMLLELPGIEWLIADAKKEILSVSSPRSNHFSYSTNVLINKFDSW